MQPIQENQRRRLFALLQKAGLTGERSHIVYQETNGRTSSTKELTTVEAANMIKWLQKVAPIDQKKASIDTMKRKLLAQFHQMGWYKADSSGVWVIGGNGQPRLDYDRINAWCIKYSPAKKSLHLMTYNDLVKVVTIAEKMKTESNGKR